MSSPYGYVYEIVNLSNGKTYVGSRKLSLDKNWRQYLGSGKLIKQAIKKYGRDKFVKRFIQYANTLEELYDLEISIINSQKKVGLAQYNIFVGFRAGGNTFSSLSAETIEQRKKKHSNSAKNSAALKKAIQDRVEKNILEREKVISDNRERIILLYLKYRNIKKVADELNLPRSLISETLKNEEIELNHQNKQGYTVSAEKKKSIRLGRERHIWLPETLREYSPQSLEELNRLQILALLRKYEDYLIKEKEKEDFRKKKLEEKERVKDEEGRLFLGLYLINRMSCSQIQKALSISQRKVYYLIGKYDLPTFSHRDKNSVMELEKLYNSKIAIPR